MRNSGQWRLLGVRPIDLLAAERDGSLVVIELKVFEDREHVLQGADYWQRVEAHRRRGHIWRARLFGERRIRRVAPSLSGCAYAESPSSFKTLIV